MWELIDSDSETAGQLSVYLNMIMGELWSRTGIVSDVSFRIKLPQTKIDSGLQVNQPRSDLVQRRD